MSATVTDLRTLMGWPDDVPALLLTTHLAAALRDLAEDSGLSAAPTGGADDWRDAQCWRAAATVLPLLHLFALSGAAKVGRLEGSVEWRFLTPDDAAALVEHCMAQYRRLVDRVQGLAAPETAEGGGMFWAAL